MTDTIKTDNTQTLANAMARVDYWKAHYEILEDGAHKQAIEIRDLTVKHTALVEAARDVVERHKRKVSLNGLWYYEYESEELEALAALLGTKEKSSA